MNNPANTTSSFPSAAIVSDCNAAATRIHETLRNKGCRVYVVSNDSLKWNTYFRENGLPASCYSPREQISFSVTYIVAIDLQQQVQDEVLGQPSITVIDSLLQNGASKFIVIRSYEIESELNPEIKYSFDQNLEIHPQTILVAPFIDPDKGSVSGIVTRRSQPFDIDELISPVEQALFSFSESKTMAIVGNDIQFDCSDEANLVQQKVDDLIRVKRSPESEIVLQKYCENRTEPQSHVSTNPPVQVSSPSQTPSILSPIHLQDIVNEPVEPTVEINDPIKNLSGQQDRSKENLPINHSSIHSTELFQKESRSKNKRKLSISLASTRSWFSYSGNSYRTFAKTCLYILVSLVGIFVVIPLLLVTTNVLTLKLAKNQIASYKLVSAQRIFSLTSVLSDTSNSYISTLSRVPLMENLYASSSRLTTNLQRLSEIGQDGVTVFLLSDSLIENIFNKEDLDVTAVTRTTALEIDKMITELSFLESSLANSESTDSKLTTSIVSVAELSNIRDNLLSLKVFMEDAPLLLGTNVPQNYVLLLQDYSVPRPSGGVVTHVVVPTVSGGKLIDVDTYEVGYLDEQFKGELEVPYELKEYFGDDSWSIRDIGMETNFSTNADNVLRYIDNSINLTANGVFALDDSLIFSLSNSSDELVSTETVQKAIQHAMQRYLQSSNEEKVAVLRGIVDEFVENNIQGYFVNETLQQQLESNGFAGTIPSMKCKGNCYEDTFGVVEVGDNNTPIREGIVRSADLNISLQKGLIKRTVTYTVSNNTDASYNVLLKILAPEDAGYSAVSVENYEGVSTVRPEILARGNHKEGLVFVSVASGDVSTVTVDWESGSPLDLNTRGDYSLFIRNQPGILPYQFNASIETSGGRKLFVENDDSLTRDGVVRYNTQLDRDTSVKVTW